MNADASEPTFRGRRGSGAHPWIDHLIRRTPQLRSCEPAIRAVLAEMAACFRRGNRVYLCGNGGSASDAEHWAGELLKGFYARRPIVRPRGKRARPRLARLQDGLPVVPLTGFFALRTAVSNDLGGNLEFAQLVWVLGRPGDLLIGLSTSGNARNVLLATEAAEWRNMKVIGLTGRLGGALRRRAQLCVCVPANLTHEIQEYHLAIYHALSLALEDIFFGTK